MELCNACNSVCEATVEAAAVCTKCGLIQETVVFEIAEQRVGGVTRRISALNETPIFRGINNGNSHVRRKKKRKVFQHIEGLCSSMKVPDCCETSKAMFLTAKEALKIKYGPAGDLLASVCVYAVARQDKKPITLLEAANLAQVNVFQFGRMYVRVRAALNLKTVELEPVLLIERLVKTLSDHLGNTTSLDRTLKERSVQLLHLAQSTGLKTGRVPQFLAVAAVAICAQALNLIEKDTNVFDILCNSIQIACDRTARTRRQELLNILLEASKILPYANFINKKNLITYVNEILPVVSIVIAPTDLEKDGDGNDGEDSTEDDDSGDSDDNDNHDETSVATLASHLKSKAPPSFGRRSKRIRVDEPVQPLNFKVNNNPELDENDMSDKEMRQYLRTKEEINIVQTLNYSHTSNTDQTK